ncbi:hypothetical protein [Variovorax sp. CY25R-8]|uniref:hypothetical protein n=1 Tax=Variovorax sp. CY25R-8 TaxID=2855501 RepID=UPI0021BB471F|nr:hypothetical protein [Variovorax sp. CY25R-8]MCT8176615.1 hypothetical protein [Variovorax sp. CY25R-8]
MQRTNNPRRHWQAAFLGFALLLGACGGGGGGGAIGMPPIASGNPDGQPQQPPPVQEVDSAIRLSAMDRLDLQFGQIAGNRATPTPEQWAQLRDWVLTQPEFADAGVDDASLWARFKDGRYFLYTDNWRVPQGLEEPPPEEGEEEGLRLAPFAAGVATAAAPGAARAALFTHSGAPDGDNEFRHGAPLLRSMKQALTERGYSVARQTLTIDNLKQMGEVGFFYMNTHTAKYGPGDRKEFAAMLDDNATVANDFVYREDLDAGNLIYHRIRTLPQTGNWGNPPKLAFTSKFIQRHLRFSPDALAIMLSCNSGTPDAKPLRDALKGRGAGTVVGWEGNANPNAYPSIALLVDRMAGVNKIEPLAKPNRSFVFQDVWTYLQKRKLDVTEGIVDDDGKRQPDAKIVLDGGGFLRLAPVITHLEMRADNKLVVHGDFGKQAGELSVGGTPVQVTWGENKLEATLGNATHGEVSATVNGLKSNIRQLGSWQGRVSYESKRVDGSCAGATFLAHVDIDLHLRADMQARRTEVDGALKNNNAVIVPANDTRGQWSASGRCVQGDRVAYAHSGSGPLALLPFVDHEVLTAFSDATYARLDAVEQRFHIGTTVGKSKMNLHNGDVTTLSLLQIWFQLSDYFYNGQPNWPRTERFAYASYLPVDARLNAAQGKTERADPEGEGMSLKFQWNAMQASPALDAAVGH